MGKATRGVHGRDVLFLAVLVAVISLLVFLSSTGKKRVIPRTQAHLAVAGIKENIRADAVCRSCHAEDAAAASVGPPLPENHPLRRKNCRQCHQLERKNP